MPLALDENQIEYLCMFRVYKNKSVVSAAKSLVNFFRDVCPELLPKKMQGRFTTIDETNDKSNLVFGNQKLARDIEGIELLKKAEKIDGDVNLAADRVLDDRDLKKIKILMLKEGVRKVDRHGFALGEKHVEEAQTQAIKDEYYAKMLELIKLRRGSKWDNDNEDEEMYDADEEGEEEMDEADEEGEMEMEEEDEEVSDVSDEEDEKESQSVSDIDPDDYSSSSEYASDELDPDSVTNPHGFVYSSMLETFHKNRTERIADHKATMDDHDTHRDKFRKKKESKNIGKSERMHQKNKPFMMLKKKKIKEYQDKLLANKPKKGEKFRNRKR
jgi:hypothetical protein